MTLEEKLIALAEDLRTRAAKTRRHASDPNVPKKQNPFFAPQIKDRIYTAAELVAMAEQAERDADSVITLLQEESSQPRPISGPHNNWADDH